MVVGGFRSFHVLVTTFDEEVMRLNLSRALLFL